MRRLPALLSQAAAARRAAARTNASHVGGSKEFASGTGGDEGRVEELEKHKEAPVRRWGKRAEVAKADGGGGEDLLSYFANAARALVDSGSAAAGFGRRKARGAAGDEVAPAVTLKKLLTRANLLIARDVESANTMFSFKQESRYRIIDPLFPPSPVGYIREKSNVIFRQLLRSRRPFISELIDDMGNEIFTVCRPFWLINNSIYAEVGGKEIGVVHMRWHLWRRIYDLYLGNKKFAVVENPGFWNWSFTLIDEDEQVLAKIDHNWRELGFEILTDVGQYAVQFGDSGHYRRLGLALDVKQLYVVRSLTLPERAVTLALAVSLDNHYFFRRRGWGQYLVSVFVNEMEGVIFGEEEYQTHKHQAEVGPENEGTYDVPPHRVNESSTTLIDADVVNKLMDMSEVELHNGDDPEDKTIRQYLSDDEGDADTYYDSD